MTAAVRRARTVQEACALLARPSVARRVWLVVLALEAMLLVGWRLGGGGSPPASPPVPEPVLSERAPEAPATRAEAPAAARDDPAPTPVAAAEQATPADPTPAAPPATPSPSPTPVPAEAFPSTAAAPAPAATASPDTAPLDAGTPRPRLGGHGVAVGIFADPANAERASQRLRNAGLPVVVDPLESARGPLTRVRVGPFATREEAVNAAETVRNLGLEARVYGPR
jgi:cell division septation protein DedD